jgi:hypothetical protein
MERTRRWGSVTAVVVAAAASAAFGAAPASAARSGRAHAAEACANPELSAPRDPTNPLALPLAPGPDPLHGAHFFVDGPAHGTVAKAIEQLIGDTTQYSDTDTWEAFRDSLLTGPLSQLITSQALASKVNLLIKIGDQEETNNLSLYSMGGGRGAIYAQTLKINCQNMLADPSGDDPSGIPGAAVSRAPSGAVLDTANPTVPVFSTFFVYPNGVFCPSYVQLYNWGIRPEDGIRGHPSIFKRMINEMAAAQGARRAVYLLEIDSIGASGCMKGATLKLWEYLLRYEIKAMSRLPHTVVYQEAGASDEGTVEYTAHLLHDVCVEKVNGVWVNACALMRGFWTNGTHFNWSIDEIRWAQKVSKLLDKLIFKTTRTHYYAFHVVNSAQNGKGPLRPRNRVKYGNEYLCNPHGRGLGRKPTADTAPTFDAFTFDNHWSSAILDAFLWSGVPGRSHNSNCSPGAAPAGVFDVPFALELAQNANQQLGPGYPSLPY